MNRLSELARARLNELSGPPTSLEGLWGKHILESVATDRIVEPETAEVRRFTTPDVAWRDIAPWPRDHGWFRLASVEDAHRLAIVRDDRAWLTELVECWKVMPLDAEASRLRALGEVGLGLAPGGNRPFGWDADEVGLLISNDVMRDDVAPDRAWIALAASNLAEAREALGQVDASLAGRLKELDALPPETALRQLMQSPEPALQIERRALRALVERASARST